MVLSELVEIIESIDVATEEESEDFLELLLQESYEELEQQDN